MAPAPLPTPSRTDVTYVNWSAVRTICATRAAISVASSPDRNFDDSEIVAMPPRTRSDVSVTPFGIVERRSSFVRSPFVGPASSERIVAFTPPSADSPACSVRLRATTRPSPAMKNTRTERAALPTGGAPSRGLVGEQLGPHGA